MGYSEKRCSLCAVSFNVGRIRSRREPQSAAWVFNGKGNSVVDESLPHWEHCKPEETGCSLVKRLNADYLLPFWHAAMVKESETEEEGEDDEENDPTYTYESADEPACEFESDDELSAPSDGDNELVSSSEVEEDHDLYAYAGYLIKETAPELDIIAAAAQTDEEIVEDEEQKIDPIGDDTESTYFWCPTRYEHVAGPKCEDIRGYNGFNITAEEMKHCNTFQCLSQKKPDWKPERHDQEFELESNCFLTGLSDNMCSRDEFWTDMGHTRHGLTEPHPENIIWDTRPLEDWCMPFHPTCFDIYLRLSRLHFGRVDIDGLMRWYHKYAHYKSPRTPRHPDIQNSAHQWWEHKPGLEYLAANPVFVPRLGQILQSAIQTDPSFTSQAGAFKLSDTSDGIAPANEAPDEQRSTDPFHTLPEEMKLEVLGHLSPKDIANLRSSSRAFRQLPILLWHQLIRRDMPWLWEISSDERPYLWACVKVSDLRKDNLALESMKEEISLYRDVIREEMPEILDIWTQAGNAVLAGRPDPILESEAASLMDLTYTIPIDRVNWYQLYTEITRNWANLKGLRNRQRIWNDIEEIVRQILSLREETEMELDIPFEDLFRPVSNGQY